MAQVLFNDGQLQHGQEVDSQFLESCRDSPAFFEPTDAAFHDASTTVVILVKRHAVVADLVFLARDHHPDLVLPQPVADPLATVALVTGERTGPCTGAPHRLWNSNRVHHRLEPLRFVALTGTDLDRERQSRTVSNQVELAPESAA